MKVIILTRFLVLNFILLFWNLNAQNTYVFHQFNSPSDYFFSVKNGLVNYNSQSNNTNLLVNYNFSTSNNSSFSLFYNYGLKVQDFSFNPHSFLVKCKGGGDNMFIKLQLWEDINLNGFFDGEDEVFISSAIPLNFGDFEDLNFDISSFTKIEGTGDSELNLNRIRAIEVVIESDQVNMGLVELDFIALKFEPEIFTPNFNYNINGAYIQLWNDVGCKCGAWTKERWSLELEKMEALCLEELIIQYSVYDNVSWYNTTQQNFVNWKFNALNNIFEAALDKNIKIVLGTYFDENWNHDDKSIAQTYTKITDKNIPVIQELNQQFGTHPNFGGWYIPQEINDLEWQVNPKKELLFNWLKTTTEEIRKVSDKKIIIAPFFNLWLPADKLFLWYKDLHQSVPLINVIALQDGVGIGLKRIDYHLPLFFSPLLNYFKGTNLQLGITLENFEQTSGWPIDNGTFSAKSANILRFKKQIDQAKNLQLFPIYTFEWGYLQNQNNNIYADELYNEYVSLTPCIPTSVINTFGSKQLNYKILKDNIVFNEEQDVVWVYNLAGQLVAKETHVIEFNLQNLNKGVYLLHCNQNQKIKIVK